MKTRLITGLLLIVIGIALTVWLALYVMLYGGIMAAINNWGTNNSAVVWGIIQAVFFQIGAIPGVCCVAGGWYTLIK